MDLGWEVANERKRENIFWSPHRFYVEIERPVSMRFGFEVSSLIQNLPELLSGEGLPLGQGVYQALNFAPVLDDQLLSPLQRLLKKV